MRVRGVCSVRECCATDYSRGFCRAHYQRFGKYGDPLGGRAANGELMLFINEVALQHVSDACLTWPYAKADTGYGQIKIRGQSSGVHRYVCEMVHGAPPTPDREAAHSCGNRLCVNPRHLRWATSKENHSDRVAHGTHNRGGNSPHAKLTEQQAREVLRLKGFKTQTEIASQYGVNQKTVSRIHNRIAWSWLEV